MRNTNKRRMNILVASVLCIILAGGAFAFVQRGPLEFTGTVTADARLEMQIMPGAANMAGHAREISLAEALSSPKNVNAPTINTGLVNLDLVNGLLRHSAVTDRGRVATFSGIEFTGPAAVRVSFRVENTGTMPSRFVDFNEVVYQSREGIEVSFEVEPWEDNSSSITNVARDLNNIAVGEFFWVNMDIALIDGGNHYELLNEILSFTVEMNYAMADSITVTD